MKIKIYLSRNWMLICFYCIIEGILSSLLGILGGLLMSKYRPSPSSADDSFMYGWNRLYQNKVSVWCLMKIPEQTKFGKFIYGKFKSTICFWIFCQIQKSHKIAALTMFVLFVAILLGHSCWRYERKRLFDRRVWCIGLFHPGRQKLRQNLRQASGFISILLPWVE